MVFFVLSSYKKIGRKFSWFKQAFCGVSTTNFPTFFLLSLFDSRTNKTGENFFFRHFLENEYPAYGEEHTQRDRNFGWTADIFRNDMIRWLDTPKESCPLIIERVLRKNVKFTGSCIHVVPLSLYNTQVNGVGYFSPLLLQWQYWQCLHSS